jgi:cytidine deaminase
MNDFNPIQLLQAAKTVRLSAYAPYSGFKVGAAVFASNGTLFTGCNVENASYGATCCAERNALFQAIAAGVKPSQFVAMAIVADTSTVISPCGICRQVIAELCPADMPILLANMNDDSQQTDVQTLFPQAFTSAQLFSKEIEETNE